MRICLGACCIGLVFAALTAGCGAGGDATERQLSELRAELTRVRAEGAVLSERLDALERARAPHAASAPRRAAAEPDRPSLDVVRVDPGAAPASPSPPAGADLSAAELPDDDPAADAERPVLRSGRGGEVIAEVSGAGSPRGATARPPVVPRQADKQPSPLSRRP